MRNIFGIIMIIVYIGMGILCFCGVFDWPTGAWAWLRWVAGGIFVVYGIWRGYRQLAGIDNNPQLPSDETPLFDKAL